MPVQVNGKVRGAPDRAGRRHRRRAARAGAGRRGRARAHRRQDDPEGGRREGTARQRGGVMTGAQGSGSGLAGRPRSPALLLRRSAVSVCSPGAATRSPAAARFCPPTSRRSASRRSPTARRSSTSRRMLTQKVRSEFIGRGKYQILPEATGVDALLTGEVTGGHASRRPASPPQQLASRYAITMTAQDRAARHAREQGALGEPRPGVPPGVRRAERHDRGVDPGAVLRPGQPTRSTA